MAVQLIQGAFDLPRPPLTVAGTATLGTQATLTTAGHKAGMIFQAPKAGDITKIVFRTGTVSGTSSVTLRIETVDTATGLPSGTLVDADATGSQGSLASNTAYEVTLAGNSTVTRGQLLALVIDYAAGTSIVIQSFADEGGNARDFPYCLSHNGTSWTKAGASPTIAVGYSDGSFGAVAGCWPLAAVGSTTVTSASTPDVVGIQFTVPFGITVVGAWAWLDCSAANADFNVKLYDTDGTTVLASHTHTNALRVLSQASLYQFTFDAAVDLDGETAYRLGIEGSNSGNVIVQYFDVSSAAAMDAVPGGQDFIASTSKDPASDVSWTQTATRRYFMGLRVGGINTDVEVTESGGMFIIMDS